MKKKKDSNTPISSAKLAESGASDDVEVVDVGNKGLKEKSDEFSTPHSSQNITSTPLQLNAKIPISTRSKPRIPRTGENKMDIEDNEAEKIELSYVSSIARNDMEKSALRGNSRHFQAISGIETKKPKKVRNNNGIADNDTKKILKLSQKSQKKSSQSDFSDKKGLSQPQITQETSSDEVKQLVNGEFKSAIQYDESSISASADKVENLKAIGKSSVMKIELVDDKDNETSPKQNVDIQKKLIEIKSSSDEYKEQTKQPRTFNRNEKKERLEQTMRVQREMEKKKSHDEFEKQRAVVNQEQRDRELAIRMREKKQQEKIEKEEKQRLLDEKNAHDRETKKKKEAEERLRKEEEMALKKQKEYKENKTKEKVLTSIEHLVKGAKEGLGILNNISSKTTEKSTQYDPDQSTSLFHTINDPNVAVLDVGMVSQPSSKPSDNNNFSQKFTQETSSEKNTDVSRQRSIATDFDGVSYNVGSNLNIVDDHQDYGDVIMDDEGVDFHAARKSLQDLDLLLSQEGIDIPDNNEFSPIEQSKPVKKPKEDKTKKDKKLAKDTSKDKKSAKDAKKKKEKEQKANEKKSKQRIKEKKGGLLSMEPVVSTTKTLSGTSKMKKAMKKDNGLLSQISEIPHEDSSQSKEIVDKSKKKDKKNKQRKKAPVRIKKEKNQTTDELSPIVEGKSSSPPQYSGVSIYKGDEEINNVVEKSSSEVLKDKIKVEKRQATFDVNKKRFKTQEDTSSSRVKSQFPPYTQSTSSKEEKIIKREQDKQRYARELKVIKTSADTEKEFEIVEKNRNNKKTEVFAGSSLEVFVDQYQIAKRVFNCQNTSGRKRTYPLWRRVPYYDYRWGMTKKDLPMLSDE
ncbi:hypothetical protein QTN25_008577 [Entamoeba marina]